MASIAGAKIVIDFKGTTISSTSVTTMAIVTSSVSPQRSYIECYFQSATGQVGLRLRSKDQRRVEAFFQQILTAAGGGLTFQITAYSNSTYQPNGYVASLESSLVYLLIS